MRCPFCQKNETKVIDSRILKEGYSVRRRRKCEACQRRFTTYESIEVSMPAVVKLDGRREEFKAHKIKGGIEKACQKRPISREQIDHILDNIEKSIFGISGKEVTSKQIGNLVMMHLRNLDPVAYVRFASVYREFQDVKEFVNELQHDEISLTPPQ